MLYGADSAALPLDFTDWYLAAGGCRGWRVVVHFQAGDLPRIAIFAQGEVDVLHFAVKRSGSVHKGIRDNLDIGGGVTAG